MLETKKFTFKKKHCCIILQKRTLYFWPCNFTNISKYIHTGGVLLQSAKNLSIFWDVDLKVNAICTSRITPSVMGHTVNIVLILQTLQGFCLDLLEQMSDQVGFKYVLELVPDNNYGAMNITSGEWNGLVKGML